MKKTKDLHLRVDLFDEKIIKIKAKESGYEEILITCDNINFFKKIN